VIGSHRPGVAARLRPAAEAVPVEGSWHRTVQGSGIVAGPGWGSRTGQAIQAASIGATTGHAAERSCQ